MNGGAWMGRPGESPASGQVSAELGTWVAHYPRAQPVSLPLDKTAQKSYVRTAAGCLANDSALGSMRLCAARPSGRTDRRSDGEASTNEQDAVEPAGSALSGTWPAAATAPCPLPWRADPLRAGMLRGYKADTPPPAAAR